MNEFRVGEVISRGFAVFFGNFKLFAILALVVFAPVILLSVDGTNDYAAVRRASWEGGLVEEGSELSAKFLRLADDIRALSGGASDVAVTEQVGVEVRDV